MNIWKLFLNDEKFRCLIRRIILCVKIDQSGENEKLLQKDQSWQRLPNSEKISKKMRKLTKILSIFSILPNFANYDNFAKFCQLWQFC